MTLVLVCQLHPTASAESGEVIPSAPAVIEVRILSIDNASGRVASRINGVSQVLRVGHREDGVLLLAATDPVLIELRRQDGTPLAVRLHPGESKSIDLRAPKRDREPKVQFTPDPSADRVGGSDAQ